MTSDPAEVTALRHQVSDLQQQLAALRLSAEVNSPTEVTTPASGPQISSRPDTTEALRRAAESELEAARLRQRVGELEAELSVAASPAELSQLRQRVTELETFSASSPVTAATTTKTVNTPQETPQTSEPSSAELAELRRRVASQESELSQLRGAGAELEELRREQEDLLVLLTDQEARQEEYKRRLRQLGVQVRQAGQSGVRGKRMMVSFADLFMYGPAVAMVHTRVRSILSTGAHT